MYDSYSMTHRNFKSEDLNPYELRQVISSLDDMHQIMYKLQSSNEVSHLTDESSLITNLFF